jgi:hypothetical protein
VKTSSLIDDVQVYYAIETPCRELLPRYAIYTMIELRRLLKWQDEQVFTGFAQTAAVNGTYLRLVS